MQEPSSPRRRSKVAIGLGLVAGLAATGATVAAAQDDVALRATEGQVLVDVRADEAPDAHRQAWLGEVGEYVETEAARLYAIAVYERALEWQAAGDYAAALAATASSYGGGGGSLAAIRACESGGDYSAVSSSGTYRGAYQFDQQTWQSVGGSGDPAAASPAEQDMRAQMLYDQRGSSPWPVCGS